MNDPHDYELLAPAGSVSALKAAVNAGADAVYIGGQAFGARAFAENPDEAGLLECIEYCHLRNRRIYLTVNTLFKEDELENRLFSFLRPFYEAGIDAVIVQDPGAISFIDRFFSGLPIHLSTQASVTCLEGALALKSISDSITRVVPARELNIEELLQIKRDSGLEVEVFVHGALCYCYSGQCLLSSMIGGRSGNRGRCAQPCRRLYDGKYLLSPKDQCLLTDLGRLMDIGIDSFKIEGRMKSPEYTAGVVSVYRRYIDYYKDKGSEAFNDMLKREPDRINEDIALLKDLYNRGGFNSGYLDRHNGQEMMALDRPNHTGTEAGEVVTVRGREAVIRFSEDVYAQDVLEIRDGNERVFEFTLGASYEAGQTAGCITMKDRRALVGQKVYRTKCDRLLQDIRNAYIEKEVKVPVNLSFSGHEGAPSRLSFEAGGSLFTVEGQTVQCARNAPSSVEDIAGRLKKLGETDFTAGSIDVDIGDNVFIPSGELNRMRREACEGLKREICGRFRREALPSEKSCPGTSAGTSDAVSYAAAHVEFNAVSGMEASAGSDHVIPIKVSVWDRDSFMAVLDSPAVKDVTGICYNISDTDTGIFAELAHALQSSPHIRLYAGLPYICRGKDSEKIKGFAEKLLRECPGIGFVARNHGEIWMLRELHADFVTDYNVYMMNRRAVSIYGCGYTLPAELSCSELKAVAGPDSELIIYGDMPVMFSAQCVYKNKFGLCRHSGHDMTAICDETGHVHRCMQVCGFCCNIIYNPAVCDLRDCMDEIRQLKPGALRYDFTFETPDAIRAILAGGKDPSGVPVTHGHFHRGIQ